MVRHLANGVRPLAVLVLIPLLALAFARFVRRRAARAVALAILAAAGLAAALPAARAADPTYTVMTVSPDPFPAGALVQFTATVREVSDDSFASGPICIYLEYTSGGSPIGGPACGTVPSSGGNIGTYFFNFSGIPAGDYKIWAEFDGNAAYAPSISPTIFRSTSPAATTTTLVSSLNPSIETQSATFTAAVTSIVGPTPTGNVEFRIDGGLVATVSLNNSAQASLTTSTLPAGPHTIKADYLGDTAHSASSATLAQQVDPVPTITIAPPALPNGDVGMGYNQALTASGSTGSYTFTRTGTLPPGIVLNSDGTLTGTATTAGTYNFTARATDANGFYGEQPYSLVIDPGIATLAITSSLNPSQFGDSITFTATATGGGATPTGTVDFLVDGGSVTIVPLANGVATFTTSALTPGNHTITAAYSGDLNYSATSDLVVQTVDRVTTTTTVAASPNPSSAGDNVIFDATVSPGSGSGTPTGTITFKVDGIAGSPAPLAGGSATFSSSALTPGAHTIEAAYSGDANHDVSAGSVVQTVNGIATTTTAVSDKNPSASGDSVTFTVTVAAGSGGTPTGSVDFSVDGTHQGTIGLVGGVGQVSTSILPPGSHLMQFDYGGDATFAASTDSMTQVVKLLGATGFTLSADPNPSAYGQAVTFTATVAPDNGRTPTGAVTFLVDGVSQASPSLDGSGVASFTTATLEPGSHTIRAEYAGDANFLAAATDLAQTVFPAGATLALASSLNPSTPADTVVFTATVTGAAGSGMPTGSVTFEFADGAAPTQSVGLVGGVATMSVVGLPAGTHQLNALYGGDAHHLTASNGLAQAVDQIGTTLSLATSANPSLVGDSVTFTATVAAASGGAPTGTVTFSIDGTPQPPTALAGGSATLSTDTLASGAHQIVATYSGDALHLGSNDALTQTVDLITTSITLASSANPSQLGDTVTFTASVTAASGGAPGGTVTFSVDGTDQSPSTLSGGVATFDTAALTSGTHVVVASYDGDPTHSTSVSAPLSQEVVALGSIVLRQTVEGDDASFAFTSPTPELNVSVTTSGGTGESAPASLAAGAYVVTAADSSSAGYALTAISCNDADSAGDVAGRTATIRLSAGESVVCTFVSVDTRTRTTEMIGEFMEQRAGLIMQNQPDLQRRIDRLNGNAAGSDNPLATMLAYLPELANGGMHSMSTSLASMKRLSGDVEPSAFDVWFEGAYARLGSDSDFGLVTLGADYLVSRNLLVGAFVQVDSLSMAGTLGGSVEGTGWLAGPYLTARITDNLFLDVMAGAGRSSNEISPFGTYVDSFDATRWLASAALQGHWEYGAWTLTPRTRFSYFEERSQAYVDSLGVPIDSVRTSLGELAFGPGISHRQEFGNGIVLDTSLRFDGVLDFSSTSTGTDKTDLTGRFEAGIDAQLPGAAQVGLSFVYGGIGDDQYYGGKVRLSIPLN